MEEGFIYIWHDTLKNKFYIGSHKGTLDDGYTGSGKYFKDTYNKRPDKFKRRILEHVSFTELKQLHEREEYWLNQIEDKELSVKYYNQKKVATGGDIYNTLSDEKKQLHREKSVKARVAGWHKWYDSLSEEAKSERASHSRQAVKNPSGGSLPGESNPFYGKKHSDESRSIMSEKAKGRTNNIRKYRITFPDGVEEIHTGQASINQKYNIDGKKVKIRNFINSNRQIHSNRKSAQEHPLLGALIHTVNGNNEII